MKKATHTILLFSTLVLLASSFCFSKPAGSSLSLQGKTIEHQFAALADDDGSDTSSEFQIANVHFSTPASIIENSVIIEDYEYLYFNLSTPRFLKIRSIRI